MAKRSQKLELAIASLVKIKIKTVKNVKNNKNDNYKSYKSEKTSR
jgi:hypothetical protein